jgi:hypothetical protein
MEEKSKITDKITDKRLKNLKPAWKKGESGNPKGRPFGQKDYSTLYKEALIKLAKLNNKEPDELELEMISKGILNARAGDYKFYKDVLDRLLGTAIQRSDVSGNLKVESLEVIQETTKKILSE